MLFFTFVNLSNSSQIQHMWFFFLFFFSSFSSRDLLLCLRSRVTFTLPVYTCFITRGMSFPQAEQELRMTQSEFDRQAEITRLLLEGVSSTHVRTAPHRTFTYGVKPCPFLGPCFISPCRDYSLCLLWGGVDTKSDRRGLRGKDLDCAIGAIGASNAMRPTR